MSEISDNPQTAAAPFWQGWLPLAAFATNGFALVTVVFWIYRVRVLFAAAHPDYVAVQPATISRAISDPAIGEPFSFWITLSAILLVFGIFFLAVFYRQILHLLPDPSRRLVWVLRIALPAVVVLQASAGVGMYMLSSYRFPDFNAIHMIGSYIFFASQALVVVASIMVSKALIGDTASMNQLAANGLLRPALVRLRVRFGYFSIALVVFYLLLFQAKNTDLNVANEIIYATYTNVEPFLITVFLIFLALFQTDLLALRRLQRLS